MCHLRTGRTIFEIPEISQVAEVLNCFFPEFPSLRKLDGNAVVNDLLSPKVESLEEFRRLVRGIPDTSLGRRGSGGYLQYVPSARFVFFQKQVAVKNAMEITPQIGSVVFLLAPSDDGFYLLVDSINSYPVASSMLDCAFLRLSVGLGLKHESGAFSNDFRRKNILCYRPPAFLEYAVRPSSEKATAYFAERVVA